MKKIALTLIAVATLNACGSTSSSDESVKALDKPEPPRLQQAYDECHLKAAGTIELADGGNTIIVDTGSEYGDPAAMACVLVELDTSSAITAQMDSTTAMMGVQDAEEDGISYKWSYHPKNGVNMVVKDLEEGEED